MMMFTNIAMVDTTATTATNTTVVVQMPWERRRRIRIRRTSNASFLEHSSLLGKLWVVVQVVLLLSLCSACTPPTPFATTEAAPFLSQIDSRLLGQRRWQIRHSNSWPWMTTTTPVSPVSERIQDKNNINKTRRRGRSLHLPTRLSFVSLLLRGGASNVQADVTDDADDDAAAAVTTATAGDTKEMMEETDGLSEEESPQQHHDKEEDLSLSSRSEQDVATDEEKTLLALNDDRPFLVVTTTTLELFSLGQQHSNSTQTVQVGLLKLPVEPKHYHQQHDMLAYGQLPTHAGEEAKDSPKGKQSLSFVYLAAHNDTFRNCQALWYGTSMSLNVTTQRHVERKYRFRRGTTPRKTTASTLAFSMNQLLTSLVETIANTTAFMTVPVTKTTPTTNDPNGNDRVDQIQNVIHVTDAAMNETITLDDDESLSEGNTTLVSATDPDDSVNYEKEEEEEADAQPQEDPETDGAPHLMVEDEENKEDEDIGTTDPDDSVNNEKEEEEDADAQPQEDAEAHGAPRLIVEDEENKEEEDSAEVSEDDAIDSDTEMDQLLVLDWHTNWTTDTNLDFTQQLRTRGKELHDSGDYVEAATCFAKAAEGLDTLHSQRTNKDGDSIVSSSSTWELDDLCACRLHQALCHLKHGEGPDDFEAAIEACNQVLQGDLEYVISPSLRARALYRRAKARLALGTDENLARNDARQAAFLGDRKAVELYGQLLRGEEAAAAAGGDGTTATTGRLPSSSSLFSSLLSMPSSPSPSTSIADEQSSSRDLLSALLGNAAVDSANGDGLGRQDKASPFMFGNDDGGLSAMSSLLFGGLGGGAATATGNPKGRRSNTKKNTLMQTLSSKSTQNMICATLHSTSTGQIQQYATMAGFPLSDRSANRIVKVCHGIQPKHLQSYMKNGQRVWYGVQLTRKTGKVLTRYRTVLVLLFLLAWIRSLFQ